MGTFVSLDSLQLSPIRLADALAVLLGAGLFHDRLRESGCTFAFMRLIVDVDIPTDQWRVHCVPHEHKRGGPTRVAGAAD